MHLVDKIRNDSSLLTLALANISSLIAAFVLQWDVYELMLLFWFESAIIGLFCIIKIIYQTSLIAGIPLSIFFCVHFGGFMFGHFIFIYTIFGDGMNSGFHPSQVPALVLASFPIVWVGISALLLSHLYSFIVNYLGRKEYMHKSAFDYFMYPYGRIMIMHVTLIFSGILALFLHKFLGIVLLVALKTVTDILGHSQAHKH